MNTVISLAAGITTTVVVGAVLSSKNKELDENKRLNTFDYTVALVAGATMTLLVLLNADSRKTLSSIDKEVTFIRTNWKTTQEKLATVAAELLKTRSELLEAKKELIELENFKATEVLSVLKEKIKDEVIDKEALTKVATIFQTFFGEITEFCAKQIDVAVVKVGDLIELPTFKLFLDFAKTKVASAA